MPDGWTIVLSIWAVTLALVGALAWRARRRARRMFAAKVGLDLPGLVALLPAPLRDRTYTEVHVHRKDGALYVGLLYAVEYIYRGAPPNVGLEFDEETGELREIHPEGVHRGIK